MLYLHQFSGLWGLPSLSPFCTKVDTYLKMTGLLFDVVVDNNPAHAPKGKLPMLRDGNCTIADSTFIIQYLEDAYNCSLDKTLSTHQCAIAHATRKMIEENLYFVMVYSRWLDPDSKQVIDNTFKPFFPKFLGWFILSKIRKKIKRQLAAQGIGRHNRDEIYHIGIQDINTIAQLLGDNRFFLGDEPHTIDATVYAFLASIVFSPLDTPLQREVKKFPQLIKYVDRIKAKYF